MKKYFAVLSLVLVLCLCGSALAEGMGVQVIGGPETKTEPVSLDDIKLNASVSIENYATIVPTSFAFVDMLGYYNQGGGYSPSYGWSDGHNCFLSGNDADYALLKMDIINLSTLSKNFLSQCEIKVVFDDVYEYAGWCYQYNYDYEKVDWDKVWGGKANKECVIQQADEFEIGPMYAGHYAFGCTLPNAVINSDASLCLIINMDGNEITYNIRK